MSGKTRGEGTLLAKLTKPTLTGSYPRKRLFNILNNTRKQPVTWISAPSGSGKATLVENYLDENKLPHLWCLTRWMR